MMTTMESRRMAIDRATAICRLEGYVPTPQDLALFERYVMGELSVDEAVATLVAKAKADKP